MGPIDDYLFGVRTWYLNDYEKELSLSLSDTLLIEPEVHKTELITVDFKDKKVLKTETI